MTTKKELGAFYTTNSDDILRGFEHYVAGKDVVDPCCGDGDLLCWSADNGAASVYGYDINADTKANEVRDTICNAPNYDGTIVVSNPPYLGRNKSDNKTPFEMWGVNDLYKAAILSYIERDVEEAILIVPTNIFVDEDYNFRKTLFSNYKIENVVMFKEQMFEDTPVKVCAFYMSKGTTDSICGHKVVDNAIGKLRVGEEWFALLDEKSKGIGRLIAGRRITSKINIVRAMDTGTDQGRIKLSYGAEPFQGKLTDRQFATITFDPKVWGQVSAAEQRQIVQDFNKDLEDNRVKYDSLFLTNGQATPNKDRKRISFDTVYAYINKKLNDIRS